MPPVLAGEERPKREPRPAPPPRDPVPYDPPLIGPMIPPYRGPRNDATPRFGWEMAGESLTPAQAMRGNGGRR